MRTLKQEFQTSYLIAQLVQDWRSRLKSDFPEQSTATSESIIGWLLGKDLKRLQMLSPTQLEVAQQAMAYRYRILKHRYLDLGPEPGYRQLLLRLSSLVVLRQKIRTWVNLSRDRSSTVVDVLQEVLQELLQSDRYLQAQIVWISECTQDKKLRNALLFASTEEYCLRPIRNQPLLVYQCVNYLRRSSRGGLTQIPGGDLLRLVSEELLVEESDSPISLLNTQAVADYQNQQAIAEQQALRTVVQQEFESYLAEHLGAEAVQWLQLYLQGRSQEEIAQKLKLEIKQVYRCREKVTYHAVRVFALKGQPELVSNWLETSLQNHNFGLTAQQWRQYWQNLRPLQRQVLELFKSGKTVEAIAEILNLKAHQVIGEWGKVYSAAQTLRSGGKES